MPDTSIVSLSLYPRFFQNTQSQTRPQRPRSPPLPDIIKNAPSRPPPPTPLPKSVSQPAKSSSALPNNSTSKRASTLSQEEPSTSRTPQHTMAAGKSNSTSKTFAKPSTKPPSAAPQNPKSSREAPSSKAVKVPALKKSATVKCPQVRLDGMKTVSSFPAVLRGLSCSVSWGLHCGPCAGQRNFYFTLELGSRSTALVKTCFISFLLDQTVSPEKKRMWNGRVNVCMIM